MIPNYVFGNECEHEDPHAVVTIELGELILSGLVDWEDPSWRWDAYNDAQYIRMCEKIENRYWHREISLVPLGVWKREFLRVMNEIMPKYKILYKRIDEGLNPLQEGSEYGKSRNIFSEFPETMLSGNSDYASTGNDNEYEHIREGDLTTQLDKFARAYRDVDVMILDELEKLFSCLYTVSINGF